MRVWEGLGSVEGVVSSIVRTKIIHIKCREKDVLSTALGINFYLSILDEDAGVEEWEAELEGELNEFEVVSSKDGNEDPTDDMTETEIQEMLDAEDGTSSTDSLKRKWIHREVLERQ